MSILSRLKRLWELSGTAGDFLQVSSIATTGYMQPIDEGFYTGVTTATEDALPLIIRKQATVVQDDPLDIFQNHEGDITPDTDPDNAPGSDGDESS